jgi:hypothetical protein
MRDLSGPTEMAAYERELKHKQNELELHKREQAQKEHNDRVMVRITATSVIVTVFAVLVAFWTGMEARKARIEAGTIGRESLEKQSRSIDAQIAAMKLDERPYILVQYDSFTQEEELNGATLPSERGYVPHITLTSVGRTPALNITIDSTCNEGFKTDYSVKSSGRIDYAMLIPSKSVTSHCDRYLDASQPVNGVAGPSGFDYWGMVRYQDIQGDRHQTPFCFSMDPMKREVSECNRNALNDAFK